MLAAEARSESDSGLELGIGLGVIFGIEEEFGVWLEHELRGSRKSSCQEGFRSELERTMVSWR